ncbi:hypothetical protein CO540_13245 [Micromonospora sp. WMMA2032]|uniref:hypothetical protein n=1 Tax=Micromonospora sp. WMMA2032 TaxID=2039870 RepID=UPI000C059612|nr:hypothetical protein [Micromonospora sp. WMMA2032]ATO14674.1 hypothetical protein CO540_13245 [Micromonospora sp. WMMA2032]
MHQHLCVAEHCYTPRQHGPACPGGDCRGCLPRLAADGLRLCAVDVRRLAEDARTAAILHEDLALTLIRRGRGGERVAGSSSGAPVPDDEVMEARTAIRATLVGLARLIAGERGHALPADDIAAIGEFVARNDRWLAAHEAADEHARDLRDIASDPRTRRLAYPAGSDRLYIGDCPLVLRDLDGVESVCGERLYVYGAHHLVHCAGCDTEETVEWWQKQLVGEVAATVNAYDAAAHLSLRWSRSVDPSVIRVWASRERVGRHGQDAKGRTLYDLDELIAQATSAWGAPESRSVAA